MVFGSVSDSESDIKRCCQTLLSGEWEWCIAHMLNAVLVEAFGTSAKVQNCKNPGSRNVIAEVKKVIEHCNKSHKAKVHLSDMVDEHFGCTMKGRLQQGVPQRWVSNKKTLQVFLERWQVLDDYYRVEEKVLFPVCTLQREIQELYSLMCPVANIISAAQSNTNIVAPSMLMRMIQLRLSLQDHCPLVMLDPAAQKRYHMQMGPKPPLVQCRHIELTETGKITKMLLADGLDKRFFKPRYFKQSHPSSHRKVPLHDVAAALVPNSRELRYLDKVVQLDPSFNPEIDNAAALATCLRERVWGFISAQVASVVETTHNSISTDELGSSAKRQCTRNADRILCTDVSGDHIDVMGLFDAIQRKDVNINSPSPSASDLACEEVERYRKLLVLTEADHINLLKPENILPWWNKVGAVQFPYLSVVARAVFGVPPSSAVLEKDFSAADDLITRKRGSIDAVFAEMVLFLH